MTALPVPPTVLDPAAARPDGDTTVGVRRTLVTAGAVLGPILFVLGNVALPPSVHGSTAEVVAAVPAVATQLLASHLVYALGSLLLIPFVVALWRIDVRAGAGLRLAGGLLVILGGVSNALGEVTDGYLAWGAARATVPGGAQVRLFETLDTSSAALPISFLAVPVLSLGLLVLMAGVLRARVVPVWLPVLVVVGALASGFAGVGLPSLVGLVWAGAAAVTVVRAAPAA